MFSEFYSSFPFTSMHRGGGGGGGGGGVDGYSQTIINAKYLSTKHSLFTGQVGHRFATFIYT